MWVLLVAILGSAIVFIDGTAVNVALPVVGRELGASAAALQWVIEGYTLTLSALILIGGAFGDRFGRRRVFVIGNAIFGAASIGCALAPNIDVLIVARLMQGIGGAFATPGSLALISANFKEPARGKAIGTWSGFSAMTSAIGPVLGGWLAQTAGWRSVFILNVPLVIAVIAISQLCVPESDDPSQRGAPDLLGAGLATLGLGALTYGLIRGQGIPDAVGVASALAGAAILAVFILRERTARNPMLPLGIFANRIFSGVNAYTFFLYATLGGSLYFLPFELQNVRGYSPAEAGAALLPFVGIMFAFSRWSGGLAARIGARVPLVAGGLVAAVGYALFAFSGLSGSYWESFFPGACVLGIGGALFVAPLTAIVMDCLGQEHAGLASGVNNAVARVAGLIAIAVLGIALLGTFYRDLDRRVAHTTLSQQTRKALDAKRAQLPQIAVPAAVPSDERERTKQLLRASYAMGFRVMMLISSVLCILAAAIAALTIPSAPGRKASDAA